MITYILIGIVFMFCVEWGTNTNTFKNHMLFKGSTPIKIGWAERFMGIFFWPVCLGVFIYYFLTNLLNK